MIIEILLVEPIRNKRGEEGESYYYYTLNDWTCGKKTHNIIVHYTGRRQVRSMKHSTVSSELVKQ